MSTRRRTDKSGRSGRNQQPPPGAHLIVPAAGTLGVLLGLVALRFGAPAWPFVWLTLTVAAWAAVPPVLTGTDAAKNLVPQGPVEERAHRAYRFASSLKWALTAPVDAVLPGWPPLAAWVLGLAGAALTWLLPHRDLPAQYPAHLLGSVDAVFALVVVTASASARRSSVVRADRSPGVRLSSLLPVVESRRGRLLLAASFAAGATACVLLGPTVVRAAPDLPWRMSWVLACVSLFVLAAAAVLGRAWNHAALAHWRDVVEAREQWAPRWTMLKHSAAPRLTDRRHIGAAVVEEMTADGSMGSISYLGLGPKIIPTMGGANRVAVLPQPCLDSQGQPMPGSVDPLRFRIVVWPSDYAPAVTDPSTDPDELRLFVECVLSWAGETCAMGRPLLDEMLPLAATPDPDSEPPNPGDLDDHYEEFDTDPELSDEQHGAASQTPSPPPGKNLVSRGAWRVGKVLRGIASDVSTRRNRTGTSSTQSPAEPGAVPCTSQAYAITLHLPEGPDWVTLRKRYIYEISRELSGPGGAGVEVLADHRQRVLFGRPRYGLLFVGNLTEGCPPLDPESGVEPQHLEWLSNEDDWNSVWASVMKSDVNPPTINNPSYKKAYLPVPGGEVLVQQQPFVCRSGVEPREFFGLEAKVASARGSAPFVAITGWTQNTGNRRGERHATAFSVYWSDQPVPASPDTLAPSPSTAPTTSGGLADQRPGRPGVVEERNLAQKWVLAGMVNKAFKAARLAQPELLEARCLTLGAGERPGQGRRGQPAAPAGGRSGHIWHLSVRLMDGVTLPDVRAAAGRMRISLGAAWLRVTSSEDGCVIVVGASPKTAALTRESDRDMLIALDWEQAWLDAKVAGASGMTPQLTSASTLPRNSAVHVLDFSLPPDLPFGSVKAARAKLETATANAFVEVRRSPDGRSDAVRVLASETDPMPMRVDYDFESADTMDTIPFATGVEGDVVSLDLREVPHLLLAGTSGGGKSAGAQALLYGALVQGAQVAVIDIQKYGADFKFTDGRLIGKATDLFEAEALMRALHAEIKRRAQLNGEQGVGHVRELLEPPPPIVVFIDEFLGVILAGAKPPTRAEDDPELEAQRQEKIRTYQARKQIGFLAGRFAAEARSADVHLVLATQKLTQAMLDDDLADLKAVALDTRLPVPVSVRFPTGWALNRDLRAGDLLYAPDGRTTPVASFSEVFTDSEMFEVVFDDGQHVVADGEHLWSASDRKSRGVWGRAGATRTSRARSVLAARCRAHSHQVPIGTWATPGDIARLLGMQTSSEVRQMALSMGLDVRIRDAHGHLAVADRSVRADVLTDLFDVPAAVAVMDQRLRTSCDLVAVRDLGAWASVREISDAAWGEESSPARRCGLRAFLREARVPVKPGHSESLVIEVSEFCTRLADHIDMGGSWSTDHLPPQERVVSTREMFESQKTYGQANWAVPLGRIGDGDQPAHMPVDPYVLGAWLGDGSSACGALSAGDTAPCTGPDGRTDADHLIAELEAAGYQPRRQPSTRVGIGTRGLKTQLRGIGVLDNKHIPAPYLRASSTQRLSLLQGLMDTDGTWTANGGYSISQVSPRLAMGVLELVRSLGIKAHLTTRPSVIVEPSGNRRATGAVVHSVAFRTAAPVFRNPRKAAHHSAPVPGGLTTRRTIRAIRRVESVPSRCIAVEDPGHMFLVEGFIPTHNTNLARALLGKTNSGERMSALRDFEAAPPLGENVPKGRGVWESTMETAKLIQFWYAEQDTYARELAARVPSIEESQILDISAYRSANTVVQPVAGTRIERPADEEPRVIELGSLEFTLDDLEDPAQDNQAQDNQAQDNGHPDRTALGPLPDVGPVPEPVAPGRGADVPEHDDDDDDLLQVDWGELDPSEWQPEHSAYDWVEIDALLAFLDAYPSVRDVTWTEPNLRACDSLGVPFAEVVTDLLADRGVSFAGPDQQLMEAATLHRDEGSAPAPAGSFDEFDNVPRLPSGLRPQPDPFD